MEAYNQARTTSKYLYQTGLPAMSQMTICFWAKLEADDDNRREDWLVSIARQGLCGQFFFVISVRNVGHSLI